MERRRDKIESSLKKKGFELQDTKKMNRDHRMYHLMHDNKPTGIWTKISTGKKYRSYKDNLLNQMKAQLKLDTREQLCALIDCGLDEPSYKKILREKKILRP